MPDVVSKLMKINLRVRSRDRIEHLLVDVLGATAGPDRGADTRGDFEGAFLEVAGVTFDVMVPNGPDSSLAGVIERHGEGIDLICFSVDEMATRRWNSRSKASSSPPSRSFAGTRWRS